MDRLVRRGRGRGRGGMGRRKQGQEDSVGEGGSRRGTKRMRGDYSSDSWETECGDEAGRWESQWGRDRGEGGLAEGKGVAGRGKGIMRIGGQVGWRERPGGGGSCK